jgi:hypothetical protein
MMRQSLRPLVQDPGAGRFHQAAGNRVRVLVLRDSIFHLIFLSTRPAEASRAVRKKLKHGDTHQQYRGMVVRTLAMSSNREHVTHRPM